MRLIYRPNDQKVSSEATKNVLINTSKDDSKGRI